MKYKNHISTLLIFIFFGVLTVKGQEVKKPNKKEEINKYISRINSKVILSDDEKDKLFQLKEKHTDKILKTEKKYKNHTKLKDEILKLNAEYSEFIVKEFGKKRGVEILEAARILQGAYSIKLK